MRTSAETTLVVPTVNVLGRREGDAAAGECGLAERRVLHVDADVEIPDRIPQRARPDLPGRPIRTAGAKSIRRADQRVDGGTFCALIDITAVEGCAQIRHPIMLDARIYVPCRRQL